MTPRLGPIALGVLFIILAAAQLAWCKNCYVDNAATGSTHNGSSWATAWTSLGAITGVSAGDTASYFNTDKDGIARPQGSAWDMGAYEYTSNPGIVLQAENNNAKNPFGYSVIKNRETRVDRTPYNSF